MLCTERTECVCVRRGAARRGRLSSRHHPSSMYILVYTFRLHMPMRKSLLMYTYVSIYTSARMSTHVSIRTSLQMSSGLSVRVSVCMSSRIPMHMSARRHPCRHRRSALGPLLPTLQLLCRLDIGIADVMSIARVVGMPLLTTTASTRAFERCAEYAHVYTHVHMQASFPAPPLCIRPVAPTAAAVYVPSRRRRRRRCRCCCCCCCCHGRQHLLALD